MAIHGYKGGVISATAPTVSPSSASGVWTLDEQLQNSAEWPITNTLLNDSTRFRASGTAYMSRTPTSAGNRKTWTFSAWVKRGAIGSTRYQIFATDGTDDSTYLGLSFFSDDTLLLGIWSAAVFQTTQVFRDPSSWYHIVLAVDTTQATSSNRVKLYINGSQVTAFASTSYPSQNANLGWNSTQTHRIGQNQSNYYFDGYIADVNFIDGQALTPNYFGATNPNTGVWQPAQFHGTYGTNGFYLPMNIEQLQASFTRSLRFRGSSYLNRTPASAGSLTTWTWSGWIKRGLGNHNIFACTSTQHYIGWNGGNGFNFQYDAGGASDYKIFTNQVFRDPASWYHIVAVWDTTNATSSSRMRLYVNGQQITSLSTAVYPPQNFSGSINSANPHTLGSYGTASYLDGYLAEVNFIDGLALEPNLFGTVDATSGAWVPVTYAGSYGTNGFYLPFTNNTSTTTLGYDFSGKGNNWTTNNISVTAGTTYDSMTDVPTLTSATAANFATLNPLSASSYITISGGNLNTSGNTASDEGVCGSTLAVQTGKYYTEFTVTGSIVSNRPNYGIIPNPNANFANGGGQFSNTGGMRYGPDGKVYTSGSLVGTFSTFTTGDVIGIAIDADNGAAYVSKNGTWQNSGVPTSGASKTGAVVTWTGGAVEYFICVDEYNGSTSATNFGQRPFTYTPPTGYVELNTYNM